MTAEQQADIQEAVEKINAACATQQPEGELVTGLARRCVSFGHFA